MFGRTQFDGLELEGPKFKFGKQTSIRKWFFIVFLEKLGLWLGFAYVRICKFEVQP